MTYLLSPPITCCCRTWPVPSRHSLQATPAAIHLLKSSPDGSIMFHTKRLGSTSAQRCPHQQAQFECRDHYQLMQLAKCNLQALPARPVPLVPVSATNNATSTIAMQRHPVRMQRCCLAQCAMTHQAAPKSQSCTRINPTPNHLGGPISLVPHIAPSHLHDSSDARAVLQCPCSVSTKAPLVPTISAAGALHVPPSPTQHGLCSASAGPPHVRTAMLRCGAMLHMCGSLYGEAPLVAAASMR